MKGGITSGVVYPWAVCELATTYRLRNIGGTSAGAIAAAAAAAAEYGRQAPGGGFGRLAALPDWLKAGRNLRDLFQPEPATRPLFRLVAAGMGRRFPKLWKLGAVIAGFPAHVVTGAALGVALVLLSVRAGGVIRP
ncbi:MAG: RpoH suppressor, partial [Actinomycetota bacterium]